MQGANPTDFEKWCSVKTGYAPEYIMMQRRKNFFGGIEYMHAVIDDKYLEYMAGRPYLPAGLPKNRDLWPTEYRKKYKIDLTANHLVAKLTAQEIHRETVLEAIEKTPSDQKEFLCERLTFWKIVMKAWPMPDGE
ncbi:hypothetical protein ACLO93_16465 [Proteus mirabilis]|uniref:hypothetical protein n=1 Tax=Proteus mirabilis TaxID=584 RepID=UPI003D2C96A1